MAIERTGDSDASSTVALPVVDAPEAAPPVPSGPTRLTTRLAAVRAGVATLRDERAAGRRVDHDDTPDREARRRVTGARVRLGLAATAGFAGSFLLFATAPVWKLAPADPWQIEVPGFQRSGSSLYGGITFVVALLLMAAGWIGLIGRVRRPIGDERSKVRVVVLVCALWCVPMLVTPPQLSNDAYSYAAQGELAARGKDPTSVGPNALERAVSLDYWRAADPVWRDAPAPYGPIAIGASRAVVMASDHDAAASVWGFRLLAVIGVVMAGFGVASIARSRGGSPAVALALGIANPVVIVHLVGGSHNDALMMGFLALGLAANERKRRVLAVALVTCAVMVKLPAAIALVFIGWNWFDAKARTWLRMASTAAVMAASGAAIAVLSVAGGMGFGWIGALRNTGKIFSTFSVFTKLGFLGDDLARAAGWNLAPDTAVNGARLVGLAAAGAIAAVLLWRSPRIGVTKAVGLALLAFMLLGPVVWPWYLPAGFALVAAAGVHRFRPTMMVLIVSASLLVWPTSVSPIDALSRYQHWLGFGVVLLIASACVGAQWLARHAEERRDRLGLDPWATDRIERVAGADDAGADDAGDDDVMTGARTASV